MRNSVLCGDTETQLNTQLLVFNIYEQVRFHAQLSWAWKKFYNLWARPLDESL